MDWHGHSRDGRRHAYSRNRYGGDSKSASYSSSYSAPAPSPSVSAASYPAYPAHPEAAALEKEVKECKALRRELEESQAAVQRDRQTLAETLEALATQKEELRLQTEASRTEYERTQKMLKSVLSVVDIKCELVPRTQFSMRLVREWLQRTPARKDLVPWIHLTSLLRSSTASDKGLMALCQKAACRVLDVTEIQAIQQAVHANPAGQQLVADLRKLFAPPVFWIHRSESHSNAGVQEIKSLLRLCFALDMSADVRVVEYATEKPHGQWPYAPSIAKALRKPISAFPGNALFVMLYTHPEDVHYGSRGSVSNVPDPATFMSSVACGNPTAKWHGCFKFQSESGEILPRIYSKAARPPRPAAAAPAETLKSATLPANTAAASCSSSSSSV